jgi:hypothetical protein
VGFAHIIFVEYPRTNKQNLGPQYSGLMTSIKSFLKNLEEEKLDFFVLSNGRRVTKKLAPHDEKSGSWRTIGSATIAVDPKNN